MSNTALHHKAPQAVLAIAMEEMRLASTPCAMRNSRARWRGGLTVHIVFPRAAFVGWPSILDRNAGVFLQPGSLLAQDFLGFRCQVRLVNHEIDAVTNIGGKIRF